ncbi:hypothetical protein [Alkalihalobacterium alkalinitrilicum]|uniref:hypothetical protein n=1 Tax=Alkalihalobacterium alkalinitrilicum TaxID=427920 RepID=UPI0009949671|nr:hypothetical protein [Alkalihalobacterium alkalinitrilicum]
MRTRKGLVALIIFTIMFIGAWQADNLNNRYIQMYNLDEEHEHMGILEAPQQVEPMEPFRPREYIKIR